MQLLLSSPPFSPPTDLLLSLVLPDEDWGRGEDEKSDTVLSGIAANECFWPPRRHLFHILHFPQRGLWEQLSHYLTRLEHQILWL